MLTNAASMLLFFPPVSIHAVIQKQDKMEEREGGDVGGIERQRKGRRKGLIRPLSCLVLSKKIKISRNLFLKAKHTTTSCSVYDV